MLHQDIAHKLAVVNQTKIWSGDAITDRQINALRLCIETAWGESSLTPISRDTRIWGVANLLRPSNPESLKSFNDLTKGEASVLLDMLTPDSLSYDRRLVKQFVNFLGKYKDTIPSITDNVISMLMQLQSGICPITNANLADGYQVHHMIHRSLVHKGNKRARPFLDAPEFLVLLSPKAHQAIHDGVKNLGRAMYVEKLDTIQIEGVSMSIQEINDLLVNHKVKVHGLPALYKAWMNLNNKTTETLPDVLGIQERVTNGETNAPINAKQSDSGADDGEQPKSNTPESRKPKRRNRL